MSSLVVTCNAEARGLGEAMGGMLRGQSVDSSYCLYNLFLVSKSFRSTKD